jgi:hypothetical protein
VRPIHASNIFFSKRQHICLDFNLVHLGVHIYIRQIYKLNYYALPESRPLSSV